MPVVASPIAAGTSGRFLNNTAATASSHVGTSANGAHPVRVSASDLSQANRMPQLFMRILQ